MSGSSSHFRLALAGLTSFAISICGAAPAKGASRSDCVGRLQLDFPGDVEVSAHTFKSWQAHRNNLNLSPRFSDEQAAGWASFDLKISHALPPEELESLIAGEVWTKDSFRKEVATASSFPYDKGSFRELVTEPLVGAAWQYGVRRQTYVLRQTMVVRLGRHLVRVDDSSSGPDEQAERTRLAAEFGRLRHELAYRPLLSVPTVSGLCYPYVFLRDGEAEPRRRSIAVTYRLKDHPDVTIWLLHGSANGPVPARASQREAAERKADYFWNDDYRDYKSIASILAPFDVYKPVRIAGRDGVESYVEITRRDGTIDWGYLVAAPAGPNSGQLDADIMFYVLRDAAVARSKGVAPFGDAESFLRLAREISGTIKERVPSMRR